MRSLWLIPTFYVYRPDTTDLEVRAGIHTGQVTAGVLRGERARFQLFGDSVNTAGHIEFTSLPSRIQVSETTAEELRKHGKERWLTPRDDKISVKGKGPMQTYWLETRAESKRRALEHKYGSRLAKNSSSSNLETGGSNHDDFDNDGIAVRVSRRHGMGATTKMSQPLRREESVRDVDCSENDEMSLNGTMAVADMTKTERLVEWNVEVLSFLLKQILAARPPPPPKPVTVIHGDLTMNGKLGGGMGGMIPTHQHSTSNQNQQEKLERAEEMIGGQNNGKTVLDEFKEIIELPTISVEDLKNRRDPMSIELPIPVINQLRDLISMIAGMYRNNPFHSFEHASHVTASVRKLLTRIVNANNNPRKSGIRSPEMELVDSAGHSFGIVSS